VWINPFTKESATSSFQEIFDRAVTIGLQRQQLYSAKVNSPELIGVLNFEGKDIMPKDIKSSFSALGDISKGILQNRAASADAGQ
jgi:pyruvate/2-oxoacid:ferredoxin oxidoreductase alpha subunit